MRSLAGALSIIMTLAILTAPGWTQPPPAACGPYGCAPYSCGPGGCGNGMGCPPYPRYGGYGVSSSAYYQAPPPYLLGGPAYGYTYPYPWAAYCPPKTYIAPAYPSYYYYPFSGQSRSYYAGNPPYYGNNGSVFATERAAAKPAPAPAPAPAPVKTSSTSAKQPTSLPETLPSKTSPPPTADADKKPSLMRRLLFWQK